MRNQKARRNSRTSRARTAMGGSSSPVGYCRLHRFTLSARQMRNKKCLEKNCRRLCKYRDHPYWEQRERTKGETENAK